MPETQTQIGISEREGGTHSLLALSSLLSIQNPKLLAFTSHANSFYLMRRLHVRNRVGSNSTDQTDQHKMDPAIKLHTRSIKSKLITIITLIVLLSCYYLFKSKTKSFSKKYGIIIDGGSTGTRIHVFGYRIGSGGKAVFDFEEGALKVNPGLSAYAEDPEGAGGSVEELVEFGKGRVPRELWGETEVRLMATAGVRLLDLEVQDQILNVCRRVLRKSGFKFQDSWASVITGIICSYILLLVIVLEDWHWSWLCGFFDRVGRGVVRLGCCELCIGCSWWRSFGN